jgi:hypothetical protein
MRWESIEDGPKDGRMVLLWISGRVHIGNYNVGRQFWCKEEFPYAAAPAFYWMPLPRSPHDQELDDEIEEAYQLALDKDD